MASVDKSSLTTDEALAAAAARAFADSTERSPDDSLSVEYKETRGQRDMFGYAWDGAQLLSPTEWNLGIARRAFLCRNLILVLCTSGIAIGWLQSYLLSYHRQTGMAVLSSIIIGLVPTFLNMVRAASQYGLNFVRMPLHSMFVLGYTTGYLMGTQQNFYR